MLKMVLVGLAITSALDLAAVPSSLAFARTSAPGIENRRWRIAKYRDDENQKGDKQGLIEAAKTAEITFSKGRIRGSPTCGGLVGTYTLAGDQLTIQADVVIAGFCPPDQLAQNLLVLNALKGELRIEEKSDHLLLRDKSDKARVLLVPY